AHTFGAVHTGWVVPRTTRDEVQRITVTYPAQPTGNEQFTISFNGATTSPVLQDTRPSGVALRLSDLATIGKERYIEVEKTSNP
ncbi:hypothetical protein OVW21_26965, partial [Klebsiella pneumoniae]|uniref:hypothetical protein n=1 Tax=Klebsiella pneumoniae TaxID=573 RepID=UPI0022700004